MQQSECDSEQATCLTTHSYTCLVTHFSRTAYNLFSAPSMPPVHNQLLVERGIQRGTLIADSRSMINDSKQLGFRHWPILRIIPER